MITLVEKIPDVEDYIRLRAVTGMSPRSKIAAERGLPNSLFAVVVPDGETAIGMGRVVGDGGLNFEIVDIAVDPAYQGQGWSRKIMKAANQRGNLSYLVFRVLDDVARGW